MNTQARQLIDHALLPGSLEQLAAGVDGTVLQLPTGDALQQLQQCCEEDLIFPWSEIAERRNLFSINGEEVLPTSELSVVCGKAKSGKTLFSSILIAAGLTPSRCRLVDVQRIQEEPLRMLWFDTEQSRQSSKEILCSRILPLANVPPESFDPTLLLISNTTVRDYTMRLQELILQALLLHPQLIVLDGIVDLISSINDEAEARQIVQQLRTLSRHLDCAVLCVIHQNKAAEDNTLRGWVGTEAINKCFEMWEMKKDSALRQFTASLSQSRGGADPEPMKFSVKNKLPVSLETPQTPQTLETPQTPQPRPFRLPNGAYDLPQIFSILLPEGEKVRSGIFYKQLRGLLGLTFNTVDNYVQEALTSRLITKIIVSAREVYYCRYIADSELPDRTLF